MILNLSNFIYSLLLENETVIIPGFGAFISTYKPAEISGNEIKPPSKEISFTHQIKNNDGLLAEVIARRAKISQSYAMKRIEKARENMLYELDKGGTVVVENIGTLVYNENNEIKFTPFEDDNLLLDSFGLETISMEDSTGEINGFEIDDAEIEPNLKEEETDINIIDIVAIDPEPPGHKKEVETNPEVQNEIIPELEEEIKLDQNIELKTWQHQGFNSSQTVENPKRRKKAVWYWLLLILIPLFIAGYFLLNKNSKSVNSEISINENIQVEQKSTHVEAIPTVDSVPADSTTSTVITSSNTPVQKNQNTVITDEFTKYYLVGGGFKNEENAGKYIIQLKERGIEGFNLGKKGSLYLVGIGTFDTDSDAQNLLNETLRKYPEWSLWIYKK